MDFLIVWAIWIVFITALNVEEFKNKTIEPAKAFLVYVIFAVPVVAVYAIAKEVFKWVN